MGKLPLITAHSGCEQTERDSMESVERAVRLGADAVEMDVRRMEGVLFVSHNRVSREEFRSKPTLEEVFRRLRDTELRLNCDIKEGEVLDDVLDLAARFGFGPQRLTLTGSVSPEQIAREPHVTKAASVCLNIEELLKLLYIPQLCGRGEEDRFTALLRSPWPFVRERFLDDRGVCSMLKLAGTLGVQGVNMPHEMMTPPLAEAMRKEALSFSLWTVNEPQEIRRCIRLGAANITTLTVAAALDERSRCI